MKAVKKAIKYASVTQTTCISPRS